MRNKTFVRNGIQFGDVRATDQSVQFLSIWRDAISLQYGGAHWAENWVEFGQVVNEEKLF